MKLWNIAPGKPDFNPAAIEQMGLSQLVTQVLLSRGFETAEEVKQFFSTAPVLHDPFLLKDMDKAVGRIEKALLNEELIAVYGDYDCDGVTSTIVLCSYLESRGAQVLYYIPDRADEGYGLNANAVQALKDQGVGLVITVDNGISAVEEIALANQLGLDVVVTDHHTAPQVLPQAAAVVDPKQPDCLYPNKALAGVGVVFKLICALEGDWEMVLDCFGDLVALGTIADVMELKGENRFLVKEGLLRLGQTQNVGLQALMEVAHVDPQQVTSRAVAFMLAPRINACGRLDDINKVVDLLLCDDYERAYALAQELDSLNRQRQGIETDILLKIEEYIAHNPSVLYKRVLIFAGEGWHPGIIGIVAAKICEKYAKPCILIAIEGEEARGSGRSYPAFSLIDAITACSQHLTRFGGHVQAAGLSIPTRDIDAFIAQMDEYTRTHFAQMPPMSLNIDLEVLPRQLSLAGVKTLAMLEPFGQGNPSPVFCIRGAVIQEITPLSEDKHLRLKLFCDHQMFTAMYFHMSSRAFLFARGDTVDLAVEAGINVYNQTESVSLKVLDMRRSNTDYGALYTCVSLIDRLCLKEPLGAAQCEYLIPVREETGRVYKALLAMKGADMPLMRFYSAILRESVPYGKMVTSLYILREMHLIEGSITRENIRLCPCKVENKVNLEDSRLLQKLYSIKQSGEAR